MSTTPNPLIASLLARQNSAPIDTVNAPALTSMIAAPSNLSPSLGSSIAPAQATVNPFPNQLQTDQSSRNRLINSGDGVSQISNPLLRGIARAADIAGTVFLPNLARAIPGTMLHHDYLVNQATQNVAQDQAQQQAAANTGQTQAQARHLNDESKALETPKAPEYDYIDGPTGKVAIAKGTTNATPVMMNGQPLATPVKPKTIEEQAYDFAVKSGKNPLDAYSAVYGAKNVKDASLPQQYLDAISSGDTTKASLIKQVIHDTQVQPKIDVHAANAPTSGSGLPSSSPGQNSPLVQAIIDGRSPAPNSRSKAGMALMAQVTAADPTYDATRYSTYQAAQKEMTSGKTGQNINALNTLINHINDARQHLPDNGSFSPLNAVENAGGSLVGRNPTGKFDTDAVGIGGEFGKLVSGGVATVDEQKHLQKLLDHNASPNTLRDNLDEIENLAHGKLEGIYKQVQSSAHPGAGSNIPSSLPSSASTGPRVGDVVDGYRFKGGNAGDQKNWVKQ